MSLRFLRWAEPARPAQSAPAARVAAFLILPPWPLLRGGVPAWHNLTRLRSGNPPRRLQQSEYLFLPSPLFSGKRGRGSGVRDCSKPLTPDPSPLSTGERGVGGITSGASVMLRRITLFVPTLLLLSAVPATAQPLAPPTPEKYEVQIRYQIEAKRNERVTQYFEMLRDLKKIGFHRDPNEDVP